MARLFCFCLLLVTLLVALSLYSPGTTREGPEELSALADLIFEPTPVNAQSPDFLGPLPIDVDIHQSHLAGPPHAPISATRPSDWPGARMDDEAADHSDLQPVSWQTTGGSRYGGTVVNSAHPGYPQTASREAVGSPYPTTDGGRYAQPQAATAMVATSNRPTDVAPMAGQTGMVQGYSPPGSYPSTRWTPVGNAPGNPLPPAVDRGLPDGPAPGRYDVAPSPSASGPYAPTNGVAPNGLSAGVPQTGASGFRMSTEPVQQVVPPPVSDTIDDAQALEGATILARVGTEVVLASEVMAQVNEIIMSNDIPEEHQEEIRKRLTEQRLRQLIDTKLVLANLKRKMPAEGLKRFEEHLGDEFEQAEVSKRMQVAKVESRAQLDEWYRQRGTSIEREKRAFIEHMMAMQWVQQQVKRDEEVTHDQMLTYYRDHQDEFAVEAKCRWEQLSVDFGRKRTKQEAYALLADMGNQVMSGANFADVARSRSEGVTADDGGQRDWITQNSLVSVVLDRALFQLPPGQLSPILEDRDQFHIVRVIERTEAGYVPFTEAQVDIKQKIRNERFRAQREAFLEEIRQQTKYTTVFDDDPDLKEAAEVSARPASRY